MSLTRGPNDPILLKKKGNITHGGPNWPPMVQKRNVTHWGSDAYKGKCLKFFHLFWSAFLMYNIRNFGIKVQEQELLWKVHVWVSNKKAQALLTLTGVWILWKEGRAPLWVGCGGFSLLHRLRRCQPSFWQITTISLNWSEYNILWTSLSCKGKKSLFPMFNFWNLFCLSYIWPLLCPEGRPGLQVSRHSGFWTFRVLDDGWIVWNGLRHKHKKRSRNRMCPTQNIQNVR